MGDFDQREPPKHLSIQSIARLKNISSRIKKASISHKLEKQYRYIILPSNKYKITWDMVNFGLLIYSAFQIPFALSFQSVSCDVSAIDILNLLVDSLFLADCVVSCVTAYHDDVSGFLVAHPREILIHYARTWLVADLASSIPLDRIICNFGEGGSRFVRFAKMLRWLKVFRLIKMIRMLRRLQDELGALATNGARLLKLVLLLCLCTHICACAWHGVIAIADCRIDARLAPSYSSEECDCEGDTCQDWNWLARFDPHLYHSPDPDPRSRYLMVRPSLPRRAPSCPIAGPSSLSLPLVLSPSLSPLCYDSNQLAPTCPHSSGYLPTAPPPSLP
jgi:hypothetical protein